MTAEADLLARLAELERRVAELERIILRLAPQWERPGLPHGVERTSARPRGGAVRSLAEAVSVTVRRRIFAAAK